MDFYDVKTSEKVFSQFLDILFKHGIGQATLLPQSHVPNVVFRLKRTNPRSQQCGNQVANEREEQVNQSNQFGRPQPSGDNQYFAAFFALGQSIEI